MTEDDDLRLEDGEEQPDWPEWHDDDRFEVVPDLTPIGPLDIT